MKMIWISALAATLLAVPAFAQTDAPSLEAALHGKIFGLRSYSADPVAKYMWLDGKLLPGTVGLHGLKVFFPDTVRVKGKEILIEGQGSTLVRDNGKIAPMGKTPMRLEIDLQGANPATVFPELQTALFFPSLKAALDGVPDFVSDMLPFSSDGIYHSTCHCGFILQDGKWSKIGVNDPKLVPPKFIKMASNSGLNQKGIDEKVSGTISLIYSISEFGTVDQIWLAKPLAPDLDESAAKSGHDNVFHPATYDGKPVGTVLLQTIPVN